MLEIRDLAVSYGMHRALHGVSAKVDKGEIVVVLGANGAGKTTLLRAVAGISEGKVTGEAVFDGRSLRGLGPDAIVAAGIALVPEGRGIFGDLTVRENLLLGAYNDHARRHEAENLARVHRLFPKLAERAGQIARTMSGGEQQMVAIGRAMMSDPRILMLDEPSLGLSPLLCKELFQSLAQIRDTGIGVLLVEQNARQSLAIADRGYLLENGEIAGGGEARAMLDDPAVQAAYLGAAGGAAPVAPKVAAAAPHSFITPRGAVTRTGAEQFAGESVEALVARAAAAAPKPRAATPPKSRPDLAKQTRDLRKSPSNLAKHSPDSPPPRPATGAPPPDDRIAVLLAELEEAARNARLGAAKTNGSEARKPALEPDEDLPTIPVYRRASVKIYRRDAAGALRQVEDR